MAAAWGGREEIVKYLLKFLQCKATVRDVVRQKYNYAMHNTVYTDEMWRSVIYEAFTQDGRDLLHACARGGNEDLVKWFVQEFDPPMALTKVYSRIIRMSKFSAKPWQHAVVRLLLVHL